VSAAKCAIGGGVTLCSNLHSHQLHITPLLVHYYYVTVSAGCLCPVHLTIGATVKCSRSSPASCRETALVAWSSPPAQSLLCSESLFSSPCLHHLRSPSLSFWMVPLSIHIPLAAHGLLPRPLLRPRASLAYLARSGPELLLPCNQHKSCIHYPLLVRASSPARPIACTAAASSLAAAAAAAPPMAPGTADVAQQRQLMGSQRYEAPLWAQELGPVPDTRLALGHVGDPSLRKAWHHPSAVQRRISIHYSDVTVSQ